MQRPGKPSLLLAETSVYKARVQADGGTISTASLLKINADIAKFKEIGIWNKMYQYIVADGGLKTDGTSPVRVTKAYDVKSTKDVVSTIETEQPYIVRGSENYFDFTPALSNLHGSYGETIAQPYETLVLPRTGGGYGYLVDGYGSLTGVIGVIPAGDKIRIYAGAAGDFASGTWAPPSQILVRMNGAVSQVWKNNLSLGIVDPGSSSISGLYFGNKNNPSSTLGYEGTAYGVIRFKSGTSNLLTSTERTELATYLQSRFNLNALEE